MTGSSLAGASHTNVEDVNGLLLMAPNPSERYPMISGTIPNIVPSVYVAEADCDRKHKGICPAKQSPLTVQQKERSRQAESRYTDIWTHHPEITCGLDWGLERGTGETAGVLKGFGTRERKCFKSGWVKE